MEDNKISEKMKVLIADEVKSAVENENKTIEDSECKTYLYEVLETNDPFNSYYDKYDKTEKISGKIFLIIMASLVPIAFIWSKVDPQMDFIGTAAQMIIFVGFVSGYIAMIRFFLQKKKAMNHYIPIIKSNIDKLEYELKVSTISNERRSYICALHYLCTYIYSRDKHTFKNYKCK